MQIQSRSCKAMVFAGGEFLERGALSPVLGIMHESNGSSCDRCHFPREGRSEGLEKTFTFFPCEGN